SLIQRFPALAALGVGPKPWEVPVILQLAATDCGAACLAMVVGKFGREVRLEDVRTAMDIGRDGASAAALIDGAVSYGVRVRGCRVDPSHLPELAPGTILHCNFSHFVVFERVTPSGVEVVDPAVGRREVSAAEVDRALTGIAIVLEKTEKFSAGK